MSLTAIEILEAKELLAEHNWKLWTGEEGSNNTAVKFTRYIGGINEIQLDYFLEFLRRFASAGNHSAFTLTVPSGPEPDISGTYQETTEIVCGRAVCQRNDGEFEFRPYMSGGVLRWKVVWVPSGSVALWISTGSHPSSITRADWEAQDAVIEAYDGLAVADDWEFTDAGIEVPVTGTPDPDFVLPSAGINYRSVTDPQVNSGKVREGIWRTAEPVSVVKDFDGRYGEKGSWVILQTLRLGYVTTLGTGGTVDWSEFYILEESGYHSNHEMPVLRLDNVSPTAVHDLVAYLNQDTYTDPVYRDDTLTGTWRRVEVKAEREPDGAYHIDVLLTDSANTDLYVRYKAGLNWKGLYHKWDANETTVAELESSIYFESTGEIDTAPLSGTSKTLRDTVVGRTVKWSRITRNPQDRTFELVVEITWLASTSKSTLAKPHGAYNQDVWYDQYFNFEDLPALSALEATYDSTDGLWRIDKELTGPNGGGLPQLNESGAYDYAVVSRKTTVVDANWHMMGAPGFDTKRAINRVFSGVQPIRQRLGGELAFEKDASGNLIGVDWNVDWDDKAQSAYSDTTNTGEIPYFGALYHDTNNDIYYRGVGAAAGSQLFTNTDYWEAVTHFNTNGGTYPNATAPDNWVTHGYQSRYGDWQSHWTKGFIIGAGSMRSPAYDGATCRGVMSDEAIYQIGDVVYYPGSGDVPNGITPGAGQAGFYQLSSATAWAYTGGAAGTYGYAEGEVLQSGSKVYTCLNDPSGAENHLYAPGSDAGAPYWEEGAVDDTALTWTAIDSDEVVSRIAIEGVGDSPFESPDYHIPIKQELQEEVEWDLDWEWNSSDTYANDTIVFYLPTGLRYKAKNTPPASTVCTDTGYWDVSTANPTGWTAAYSARYGDWRASWTKGYAYGAASLRTNPSAASTCKGPYSASALYQIGDVTAKGSVRETPQFEVLSSATAWAYGAGTYSVGDVRQSGSKIYTCTSAHADNDAYAPGTAAAAAYWSEGGLGGATGVTWSSFDEDYVVSKLGTIGVGTEPFETFVTVGVLNEDGTNAFSSSARYSFYNNFSINPRVAEAFRCTMQRVQTLELISYFAVNPHFLSAALGGRMPSSWADIAAIKTDAYNSTNGVLTITYNTENSNFGLAYRVERIDSQMDVWAVRKTIVLRSEQETDEEALQSIINNLESPSTGDIHGDIAVIMHDLTGVGGSAWSGKFLDAS